MKCEEEFQRFHAKSVSLEHDVINRFSKVFEQKFSFEEMPQDVIYYCAKVRPFIRLKGLNYNLSLMKRQKKNKKQLFQFTQ